MIHVGVLNRDNMGRLFRAISDLDGEEFLTWLVEKPTEIVSALFNDPKWPEEEQTLVKRLAEASDSKSRGEVKKDLPALVLARFDGFVRRKEHCLGRQVIGHDFDHLAADTFEEACEKIRELLPDRFLAIHTTATERNTEDGTWRLRVFELLDREATPDEWQLRVKPYLQSRGEQDQNALDIVRLFYCPIRTAGYRSLVIPGPCTVLDSLKPAEFSSPETPKAPVENSPSHPLSEKRRMAAGALAALWPAMGNGRHETQFALAGALHNEGWPKEDGLEFLCYVCRLAGDEDRKKRQDTVERTWARNKDAPTTGWTRLSERLGVTVVDYVRRLLEDEWRSNIEARLSSIKPVIEVPQLAESVDAVENLESLRETRVQVGKFKFHTSNHNRPIPPIQYLIEGIIAREEVIMFVAHGGSLKTWLAHSVALAVASGKPWLEQFPVKQGKAVIVDYESGEHETFRRLQLLGVQDDEVEQRLWHSSYPGISLEDPEEWVSLANTRPDLLIIDSFRRAGPSLDENDARADLILDHAGRVADQVKTSVIFIHHARKGNGGDKREAIRGSTAIFAACDRVFAFENVEKNEADNTVTATMTSVKDGAGRTPKDIRIQLSDHGLRIVTESPKVELKDTVESMKALIEQKLKPHSSGMPKKVLDDTFADRNRIIYRKAYGELREMGTIEECSLNRIKYALLTEKT